MEKKDVDLGESQDKVWELNFRVEGSLIKIN